MTPRSTPSETPTRRYLALGDSYTIGESVSSPERFPNLLAGDLRSQGLAVDEPLLLARTGWTTGELSAAIDQAGLQGPFDLVTLLIGVNNQYRGYDSSEYETEFRLLLDRSTAFARRRPGRVIVVSIPDWGVTPFAAGRDGRAIAAQIDAFNDLNRAAALAAGARYVDVTAISRQAAHDRTLIAPDGLHPSGKMYAQWAQSILPEAVRALGE